MTSRRWFTRNYVGLPASHLRKERKSHTLQPTALVHEAYLRLVDQKNPNWQRPVAFLRCCSRT